jgi:hypothetical protein
LQGKSAEMQMQYDQQAKDRDYAYWQYQQQQPFQQVGFLANIASGFPAQGSTQSTTQGHQSQYTPGPGIGQIALGLAGSAIGGFTGGMGGGLGAGMAKSFFS